jgi:hypothetical protein
VLVVVDQAALLIAIERPAVRFLVPKWIGRFVACTIDYFVDITKDRSIVEYDAPVSFVLYNDGLPFDARRWIMAIPTRA